MLSELPAIRLGVGYRLDGRDLPSVPADLDALERVEVVYEELPGWQSDISAVRLGLFASVNKALPALAWLRCKHCWRLRLELHAGAAVGRPARCGAAVHRADRAAGRRALQMDRRRPGPRRHRLAACGRVCQALMFAQVGHSCAGRLINCLW